MSNSMTETKSEEDWQAESDARTIAEAETIKSDEKRFAAAQVAAKRMLEEKQEEQAALKRLADWKPTMFYGSKS